VLLVGVTREMGYDIIMQYAYDKNTTSIGLAQTAGGIYAGLLIVYTYTPLQVTICVSPFPLSLTMRIVEMVQDMRMEFPNWPATFQCEVLDLSSSPKSTAKIIEDSDKKYGPICARWLSQSEWAQPAFWEWFVVFSSAS
jgi:hypothetical protein